MQIVIWLWCLGTLNAVQLSHLHEPRFPIDFIGLHHEVVDAPGPDLDKYISLNASIIAINSSAAWERLSYREKMYAYYMFNASWRGAQIVPFQKSYEAPAVYLILRGFYQDVNFTRLVNDIVNEKTKITFEKYNAFLTYSAAFLQYLCNYHSFGSKKFIPELSPLEFKAILLANPLYNGSDTKARLYRRAVDELYPQVEREIFNISAPYAQMGFPEENQITAYFSPNMKKSDLQLVSQFAESRNLSLLNTRAFKVQEFDAITGQKAHFIISVGSVDSNLTQRNVTFKNAVFDLEYGDFAEFLGEANNELAKVLKWVANPHEAKMINHYIKSFKSGNIEEHIDSQRAWMLDKNPSVENNIGWIENYEDPENQRAMFSGWVAMVDRNRSRLFNKLVDNYREILPKLPWSKQLEKDKFLALFLSLNVLTYAGDRHPSGINIPNYNEVRENDGFKNVIFEDGS